MSEKTKYFRVCCPNCGKFLRVRILELKGTLRFSLCCPDCKQISTVELKDIESTQ